MNSKRKFDLEERLLDYAVLIIRITEEMPPTRAGNHISGQLLRSGTSPLSNHGEAQAAESRKDFIHKMSICFKELQESNRWLRLAVRAELIGAPEGKNVLVETDELIRIFASSLQTARDKSSE